MRKKTKYALYGAIIGDYWGSYWEFREEKPKDLKDALRIRKNCHSFTDDTAMTMAVASAVMMDGDLSQNAISEMQRIGRAFPTSYGGRFGMWLYEEDPKPYYSWGNGAPMRVSSVGLAFNSIEDVSEASMKVTSVTHDHPYGILFANMVAELVRLSVGNASKKQLVEYIKRNYPHEYPYIVECMDLEKLHREYRFNEEALNTTPQAIACFLCSSSFADCLAKALYVGGDSDTLAAIACSIASAFYGDAQVKPFVDAIPELPCGLGDAMKMFQRRYLC